MKIKNLKFYKKASVLTASVIMAYADEVTEEASAKETVQEEQEKNPIDKITPKESNKEVVKNSTLQTGDENDLAIPLAGLIGSTTALAGLALSKRKRLVKTKK